MEESKNALYDISFTRNDDVLCVDTQGKRTLETVLSITRDTVEACKEYKTKKALVDIRNLEGLLSISDDFQVPAEYFKDLYAPDILSKAAIIDLEEHAEHYKFFENVAVNRGYNIRFFNDITIALEWLGSDR